MTAPRVLASALLAAALLSGAQGERHAARPHHVASVPAAEGRLARARRRSPRLVSAVAVFLAAAGVGVEGQRDQGAEGQRDPSEEMRFAFQKLDKDEDGSISINDFAAPTMEQVEARRSAFFKLDKDKDGLVSLDEFMGGTIEIEVGMRIRGRSYGDAGIYTGSTHNGEKDGMRHGKGKMIWDSGFSYEGAWKDDKPHGEAKYYYADGNLMYEGEFKDGWFDGKGTFIGPRGRRYTGDWEKGYWQDGRFFADLL